MTADTKALGVPRYYPAPKTVLLAMDDADGRAELAAALRIDEHVVIEVEDGLELWDYLSTHASTRPGPVPDVIISDLALAGASGLEILERLRARKDMTHFILLALPSEAQLHAAEARPIAAFLYEKPVDVQDIRDALFSLTGGSFHEEAAALRARINSLARGNRFRSLGAPLLSEPGKPLP
jgi:CheY-like chemotaxis protein